MTFRQAFADDLDAVVSLTQAAYEHYTPLLGAPPIPVTEDYTPRVERGEVWLLESGADLAGLIVIEHNLEVIKTADWVLDLGPEGGDGGGELVASGTPEDIVREKRSYTGQFLRELLERRPGARKREAAE